VGERLHEARAGIKDEPDQSDRGLWYKKPHVPNSQEGPDMNRAVRVIAIATLVAGAAISAMPTTAHTLPAADLQVTVVGQDGVARAPRLCRRNFEGCSTSTIHQCKC